MLWKDLKVLIANEYWFTTPPPLMFSNQLMHTESQLFILQPVYQS